MIAARTLLNNNQVLIEVLNEHVEVVGQAAGRQVVETGIEDRLKDAYDGAKKLIVDIASDFATFLKEKTELPQKIEVEFSLGLSSTSGLWIISAKGEAAIKVKMSWEK